eukprot:gene56195-77032_t
MFDLAPVSLWIEDYSDVKALFEKWQARGVDDMETFLLANPERVRECSQQIRIIKVNRKTLSLFGARDLDHLMVSLSLVMRDDTFKSHVSELVQLWSGRTHFSSNTVNYTLSGERLDVQLNGMVLPGHEMETAEESDGILDLDDSLTVGTPAAVALGLEAVIDFEVTPNRPDWLGVAGIARDLSAAGLGTLRDRTVTPVPGKFPSPISVSVDGDACRVFSGRLVRGVKNGPSPDWLQARLKAIGLRPINTLVDITNLI